MPRILLAEDDDSLRGFLARALERAGYEVTACADGDEAAAVLDQEWDLLLTDIVMPGMDGIEVARQAGAHIFFLATFPPQAHSFAPFRRAGMVGAHDPAEVDDAVTSTGRRRFPLQRPRMLRLRNVQGHQISRRPSLEA